LRKKFITIARTHYTISVCKKPAGAFLWCQGRVGVLKLQVSVAALAAQLSPAGIAKGRGSLGAGCDHDTERMSAVGQKRT
jgi:hypothetical protein